MAESLFYPLDDPYNGLDGRKREFVAVRMERDLFLTLSAKSKAEDKDMSTLIREILRGSLSK